MALLHEERKIPYNEFDLDVKWIKLNHTNVEKLGNPSKLFDLLLRDK